MGLLMTSVPGGPPQQTQPADWPADLLCVADLPCVALEATLDLAAEMKRDPSAWRDALPGETLACFIDAPPPGASVSIATAAHRLGMLPVVLSRDELEIGEGGPVEDVARRHSVTAAALYAHSVAHRTLRRVAAAATVPVINGRCDEHHPSQGLADMLTLRERFRGLAGIAIAFVGDARDATVNSLMEAGALCGMDVRIGCPPERRPSRLIELGAEAFATLHGASITVTSEPEDAVAGADAVYTRAWARVPGESRAEMLARMRPYEVGPNLMRLAAPEAVFMHTLPARRGEEVLAGVIDGRRSVVWEQVANRVPAEQAALYALVRAQRAREAG